MEEREKPKPLNLNDLALVEEEPLDIDLDADPNAPPAPPPDGIYTVKVKLYKQSADDSGFTIAEDKNGNEYVAARLEMRIVDPGGRLDGVPIFDRVNTIVMQSTGTASIMGPLRALRVAVPRRVSKLDLARLLQTHLEGEPTIKVETQWQVREEQADGKWKTVRKGMKKFPPKVDADGNETGEYQHILDGTPAQATVIKYLPA